MRPRLATFASIFVCVGVSAAQSTPTPFEFRSGFWINLHQFLIHQAAAADTAPLNPPEWRDAVSYYRRVMALQDLMSRAGEAVNNSLAGAASAAELRSDALDPELRAVLSRAAPVYRSLWWPEHNRSNLAWTDAVLPLLAKYGASICNDIATVYQTPWPPTPIRVDVAGYAGPHGAYTTLEPTHITISSTDKGYQGDAALEMLFHESSHSMDQKVRAALEKERLARGVVFKRREFSHAVLFYTAGEITRRYLPGYEIYGVRNRIFVDGWPKSLPVLERDWKPYLDGRTDLTSAVRAVVAAYGVPKCWSWNSPRHRSP
jgi:hypothetical protein